MYTPPPPPTYGQYGQMQPRLQPMGIGDILDETFRLYRQNFTLFIATVAVLEVPAQIINILLRLASPSTTIITSGQALTATQTNNLAGSSVLTLIGTLIIGLAVAFITAALSLVISHRYLNRTITVGEAYQLTMNRFGTLLVANIWVGFRLFLLGIASIVIIGIPFLIYFAVAWSLVSQVIMLENAGATAASGRSRELIRGFWWKTLGLLILVFIIVIILSAIPGVIIGAIIIGGGGGGILLGGILSLIVSVLTRPIQIAALTLLFYDLKIRKEAFDLEAMVQQASLPAPSSPY